LTPITAWDRLVSWWIVLIGAARQNPALLIEVEAKEEWHWISGRRL